MLEPQVELVEEIVFRSSRYGKYQSISTPLSNHSKPFNQHVQGVKTWTLVGNYTAPTENYKQWFLTIHPDDMKKKHRPLSWYVYSSVISSLQHLHLITPTQQVQPSHEEVQKYVYISHSNKQHQQQQQQ
jgi:hypothetical protein